MKFVKVLEERGETTGVPEMRKALGKFYDILDKEKKNKTNASLRSGMLGIGASEMRTSKNPVALFKAIDKVTRELVKVMHFPEQYAPFKEVNKELIKARDMYWKTIFGPKSKARSL